jgi:hypothetical protein
VKHVTVKANGKGWNARAVAGQEKAAFVADPAHAIEGETSDNNAKILASIYDQCAAAVKEADAAPDAALPAKTKKKSDQADS